MADFTPEDRTRLLQFLQQRIPQPLLLAAISSAERGDVLESYRSEQRIHGMVKGSDNAAQRVSLFLTGTGSVEPSCSCGESDDSWCKHAVALLWVAGDLGFLNRNSGFVAEEARFRGGSVSARDVATVVSELKNLRNLQQPVNAFHPKVKILLDLRGDKLGVRITFDKEVQVPVAVKDLRVPSARALDNILLQLLDDEGIWDDELKFWYVSSSASLEKLLGLIREYRNEASILCLMQGKDGPRSIEFADELLSAKLIMEWEESSVELSVYWALPDGTLQLKESDLLGTGPFWTAVSGHLYRVTPEAARICSLFSYGSTITFSKPQSGPILEALSEGFFKSDLIEIKNPQHQPQTEVTRPDISLDIRAGIDSNSVDTIKSITLTATLEFQYPEAKANKNLVYLPNRELEDEAVNHLRSLGFELDASKKRFIAQGDNALDIISKPASQFPKQWKIIGFDEAKRSVKFAKLELSVAVSKASDGESRKAKPSESESQKIEWFDTKITLTQNTANIPISSLFKNSAQYSDRWVRLDSGAFARVPGGGLGSLRALLGSLDPSYRISNAIKIK